MKKRLPIKTKILNGIALGALLIQSAAASAQNGTGTATQVNNIRTWLKPILEGIVLIALLISFVGLIIALATKSQDVKSKATYFVIAIILWFAKAIIFSDWGITY